MESLLIFIWKQPTCKRNTTLQVGLRVIRLSIFLEASKTMSLAIEIMCEEGKIAQVSSISEYFSCVIGCKN